MKDKKKQYQKPSIKKVKLELDEAVLTGCKRFSGDTGGSGNKYCGHNACKTTYAS